METTYEFSATNTDKLYGYGTRTEADTYLLWLNKHRKINYYKMIESNLNDEQADTLAFNLRVELADLGLIE
jgi:hypothetical protein